MFVLNFPYATRSIVVFLIMVFVVGFSVETSEAKAPSEISVTYCNNCVPHQFTNELNEPDGPIVDYWKLWSRKTGIPVRFVPAQWSQTLHKVQSGEVDAHAGLFYSDERATFLDYGSPLMSSDTHIFIHKDLPFPKSVPELQAYRIGVMKGDLVEGWLKKNVGESVVVGFADYPSIMAALKAKTIKAFAADTLPGLSQLAKADLLPCFRYETLQPLYTSEFFPAVAKGNSEGLDLINKGMQSISGEERKRISRIWASGKRSKDPDSIIVAIDEDYPPFSSMGIDGEPQGLLVDLWREWGQTVGRQVHFKASNWAKTVDAIRAGEADIHSGLFRSDERDEYFLFSRPIHKIKTALYSLDKTGAKCSLSQLAGKNVGAVSGTYQLDYLLRHNPEIVPHEFETRADYFLALMRGDVTAVVEETAPMEALAARFGLSGALSRGTDLFEENIYAGVKKDNEPLLRLVEKGLDEIPAERLAQIEAQWIINQEDRFYERASGFVTLTADEKKWIAAHPVITIAATPDWPPFEWKSEGSGAHLGISADMLRLVADKVGLKLAPEFGAWGKLLDKMKNKELDVVPGLNSTPEREEFLLFTEPFNEHFSVLFARSEREDIKSLNDLAGKTIAVEKGFALAEILARDHPEIKLELVETTLDAIKALSTGRIDAYVGNQLVGNYLIKQYLIENVKSVGFYNKKPGRFRFGVRKDWPILQHILNKGVAAISEAERKTIIKAYTGVETGEGKQIKLTDAELDWIHTHKNIRLGVDSSWPPFEYVDKNGSYSGLAAGYVQVLSERLDLTMTPNSALTWGEALKAMENGEDRIDVLPAAAFTQEREKYLNFTKPYLTFPLVIATRKDANYIGDLDDLKGKRVGVIEGYYTHELLQTDYPDLIPVFYASVADGVQELNDGKIEAFFDNLAVISYETDSLGLENIKVAASTDHKVELSMAVRKDWPELVSLLNKTLDTINDKERTIIRNTWMALRVNIGTDVKTILMWAVPLALGAILIIVIIVAWNRRLGKEIAERKLAESRLRFTQYAMDNAVHSVLWVDPTTGFFTYVNNAACKSLGYSREELLNMRVPEVDVDFPAEKLGEFIQALRENDFLMVEGRHKTKEGNCLSVELTSYLSEYGQSEVVVCFTKDITEEKKARQERDDAFDVITSSINYASRIQRSVLPDTHLLENLFHDHFVLWEPRDVVGGDIYWSKQWGGGVVLIVGDCTGHGVPGAFMTLITTGAMERALGEIEEGNVGAFLQRVHQMTQATLGQDLDTGESDDGMELGVCYFHPEQELMRFASARFDLFFVENGEVTAVKPTKKGIGYRDIAFNQEFMEHDLELRRGRSYYMTSDGVIDQIGGIKQRGFGKKRFHEVLLKIQDKPMKEQKLVIMDTLVEYQGSQNRRDDVVVIGFNF
jgi:PAS domain S-box-containing protein